jgi:hypothetical protein
MNGVLRPSGDVVMEESERQMTTQVFLKESTTQTKILG